MPFPSDYTDRAPAHLQTGSNPNVVCCAARAATGAFMVFGTIGEGREVLPTGVSVVAEAADRYPAGG
ncbi:hypothetical protein IMZ48_19935 [Candidatus Bathyarchaeota archaeon]|nr:hypothetical protein [Candidatus Bathyarchaeota archaeon]